MIPIPRDFREFIGLLNAKRVRYLVVGGYAVAYHGYPRATGDIDIFIELSRRNATAMVEVFERFGFTGFDLKPEFFMEKGEVVRLGREPLKLEILNDISGVTFDACYRQRVKARIEGLRVNFIDLPELLRNKRASGRDKDLLDLKHLPRVRGR
ncbi:MAG: nucleotidyltransferase [Verrucomicrobia bacterium]|nr:nucleotidyltransferase [Verrucomicrobiota bacterium]